MGKNKTTKTRKYASEGGSRVEGNPFAIALIALIVIGGGYFGGGAIGLWETFAMFPDVPVVSTLDADELIINLLDAVDFDEYDADDTAIGQYRLLDVTANDEAVYSGYTLYTTKDTGDEFDVDEDYKYWYNISGADVWNTYVERSAGVEYDVLVYNQTEDIMMTAYSTDEGSVTIVNSTYDRWTIRVSCLDGAEGTGEPTNLEGFDAFVPDDTSIFVGLERYFVIRIDTNLTATDASYCAFDTAETLGVAAADVIEVCTGQYIYYKIDVDFLGTYEFHLDFDSTLGSTFDLDGIAIGYEESGSVTIYDTQS